MNSAPLLEVINAVVSYTPDRPAVNKVNLSASCGRITALLGPSGSGKSTLLRAIAGLEPLEAGEIRFAGEIWSGPGEHRAPEHRRCGVVFQDYALFPHLDALNNVGFGLQALPPKARRAKALAQLEGVELAHRTSAFPHELSGGEQQRVALARALATEPDVMVLDEPFSGLDRRLRGDLRATTAAALKASGAATVIVTHDAEEALGLADTIALMDKGRILQTGDPEHLYLKPASLQAARLLGDVESFETVAAKGVATTPLGAVDAEGIKEGCPVHVLIRPEGIVLNASDTDGSDAHVIERKIGSGFAQLNCQMKNGRTLRVRTGLTSSAAIGAQVSLSLDKRFAAVAPIERSVS